MIFPATPPLEPLQVVLQVDAGMAGLCLPPHVVGVEVEPVQEGAHRIDRVFVLQGAGRGIEHTMLQRMTLPGLGHGGQLAPEQHVGERWAWSASGPPPAWAMASAMLHLLCADNAGRKETMQARPTHFPNHSARMVL